MGLCCHTCILTYTSHRFCSNIRVILRPCIGRGTDPSWVVVTGLLGLEQQQVCPSVLDIVGWMPALLEGQKLGSHKGKLALFSTNIMNLWPTKWPWSTNQSVPYPNHGVCITQMLVRSL